MHIPHLQITSLVDDVVLLVSLVLRTINHTINFLCPYYHLPDVDTFFKFLGQYSVSPSSFVIIILYLSLLALLSKLR